MPDGSPVSKKVKAGPVSADRLKSFVERIEKLEEERKAISGDIRDVYSEAKGVGYDVKTMRKIISIRKVDAADRDEQERCSTPTSTRWEWSERGATVAGRCAEENE